MSSKMLRQVSPPLEDWMSYEYIGPGDRFNHVHTEIRGDEKYIWADDTMWSIDTPENPNSILALAYYMNWNYDAPVDMDEAEIAFFLQGDDLDLKGGRCYFWIHSCVPDSVRYHYIAQPLTIPDKSWGNEIRIVLNNREEDWHNSFCRNKTATTCLKNALRACHSLGISFIGFQGKVTGRLKMKSFNISSNKQPFSLSVDLDRSTWFSVSKQQRRQVPALLKSYPVTFFESKTIERKLLYFANDFLILHSGYLPFSYLLFARVNEIAPQRDLRNFMICIDMWSEGFDIKGGNVYFFIEQPETSTIWIYSDLILMGNSPFLRTVFVLNDNPSSWYRLSGEASLDAVLAGPAGEVKDSAYLGFIAVNSADHPTGLWGIFFLSLGPSLSKC